MTSSTSQWWDEEDTAVKYLNFLRPVFCCVANCLFFCFFSSLMAFCVRRKWQWLWKHLNMWCVYNTEGCLHSKSLPCRKSKADKENITGQFNIQRVHPWLCCLFGLMYASKPSTNIRVYYGIRGRDNVKINMQFWGFCGAFKVVLGSVHSYSPIIETTVDTDVTAEIDKIFCI